MSASPLPDDGRDAVALSWSDRWFSLRNRLLASPLFQRRAASFSLTRPIAQRRAKALFDLVAGFVYSQVMLACVQLDLFNILSKGPQKLGPLALRLGIPEEGVQRLLAAALSLQLVERRSHQRYGLGVLGATMVGNEAIAAMIKHHSALYADLADPVALLQGKPRSARLAQFWPYADAHVPAALPADQIHEYSSLMSASQPLVAHEILDLYPFGKHDRLLDVGGGEGTFLIQVADTAPNLELVLFDLPAVADRARERFAAAGIVPRAVAVGGDFLHDPLPAGADIVTLIRVVHDHDDVRVLSLLKSVYSALRAGGKLLLAEPMAATKGAEPMGDAYFGFYLLAMGRGQPRTPDQLTSLLHAAGFRNVRLLTTRMPLQTQVILAVRGPSENPKKIV